MKWPPTDLQILQEIYRRYYSVFTEYSQECPGRSTKVYVPIDIIEIAKHFKIDGDVIFGRLYYQLQTKYGFVQEDNCKVPFFSQEIGGDRHAIHFPLLASVLAELREERKKHWVATWLSMAALIVSAISVSISLS